MAHLSPNHSSNARGSFEVYDSQRKNGNFSKEELLSGSSETGAPGSPGTVNEFNSQTVLELKKELERMAKREEELREIIASLRSTQNQPSSSVIDNQFMNLEDGSGSEDVGENVKDARLKYLQRQVTVLQANLYKAEGWTKRAVTAAQDRDQAVSEANRLKDEMKQLEEHNRTLHGKYEELLLSYQELQQNLATARAELEARTQNTPTTSALEEEAKKQKMEIKTLKESVTRLENENKHLKDSTPNGNNQALGNVACSRELEYLHQVVNMLKNTVLEQRTYLLGMKNPNVHPKSLPMQSSYLVNGSLNKESPSSQSRNWSSNECSEMNGPPDRIGQLVKGPNVMLNGVQDTLLEPRQPPQRNGSAPELGLELPPDRNPVGRRLSSREVAGEASGADRVALTIPVLQPQPVVSEALWHLNGPRPHVGPRDGYINQPVSNTSTATLLQQQQLNLLSSGLATSADVTVPKPVSSTAMALSSGYIQMQNPQHKVLERKASSEVLGRRFGGSEVSGLDHNHSKSEMFGRNPEMFAQGTRKSPQWNIGMDALGVNKNNTASVATQNSSPVINQQSGSRGRGGLLRDLQAMAYNRPMAFQYADNTVLSNLVTSAAQPLPIYHPPGSYEDSESVKGINQELVAGGRTTISPPKAHQPALSSAQSNLYINVQLDAAQGGTSADGNLVRPRASSDRVCPVCNKEYSHVSMEDFQTHVFECFDDENAPETMKPLESQDRTCPMCNTKYPASTPQTEFEKHVHSHFGEEGPGEPFEILH